MSQNARESLSALMDNEGDELELRRVLKSLDDSPDAADTWRRYHLMRSLMRREHEVDVATDLSAGIMARLEDEPLPQVEAKGGTGRSMSLLRGAGIAAAVSLMVITGVQFYQGGIGREVPSDVAAQMPSQPMSSPELQASPAALGGSELAAPQVGGRPSLADLPLFQTPSGDGRGLMTVGAGVDSPLVLSPRQSARVNQQQAQLLQSYLDRHAEGAAYGSGDTWMPLLRASGSESLGQR
ncbi:sigma-E factor negative regulatory protein [Halomonas saccharevitans]|uniref:Sigma-E factor negative regulatory protein n=1 Tax=Halomonas saccharevitans TaxID=416872 RepID=A0ABU3NH43_9GAMM|nr:sigma-E factor negative regulatory protein [Halomonas saccharevitans]MDT8880476.1 sigma-E factor negative regulatory protein [Halomonas saccharevitans]